MFIWPFSSCVSYWFLLQGYTWQNWVSAPSQINNKGLCLCQLLDERLLSSCIAFLFHFQWIKLKQWVSLLPQSKGIWGFPWDDKMSHLNMQCFLFLFLQRIGNQSWVSRSHWTEQIWGLPTGQHMGWKIPSDHALILSFYSREIFDKYRWVSPPKLKNWGLPVWAVGWDFPLIIYCFCFFFPGLRAAELSKFSSIQWGNLGSSHGIGHEMIIWPFSSCFSYLFLLQKKTLQNWVSLCSQIKNIRVCLCELWDEMFLSSHIALLFLFQRNELKHWVSPLPCTQECRVSHEMTSCPSSSCVTFLFLF